MAQNEMRAMCGLPLRVRSMEGLEPNCHLTDVDWPFARAAIEDCVPAWRQRTQPSAWTRRRAARTGDSRDDTDVDTCALDYRAGSFAGEARVECGGLERCGFEARHVDADGKNPGASNLRWSLKPHATDGLHKTPALLLRKSWQRREREARNDAGYA